MPKSYLYCFLIHILVVIFNTTTAQITNPRAWAEWEETNGVILHQPNYYVADNPTNMEIKIAEEWDRLYLDLINGLYDEDVNIYYILDTNNRPEYHSSILDTMELKYGVDINHPKFHVVYGCRTDYNSLTKWTRDHGPMNVYTNQTEKLNFFLFKDDNQGSGAIIRDYLGIPDTVFTESASAGLASDGGNYMVDGNGMAIIDSGSNAMLPTYGPEFGLETIHGIKHYLNHCDYYLKLVNEETLLVAVHDKDSYTTGTEPFSYLEDSIIIKDVILYIQEYVTSHYGRPMEVIKIPSPPSLTNDSLELSYYTHHASYTNSLIVNNSVFVPQFDVPFFDSNALEIYRVAMPGYKIVPVYSRRGATWGGAVHCLTNSVASFSPVYIRHAWYSDTIELQSSYDIVAEVYSKSQLAEVSVFYSYQSSEDFSKSTMTLISENTYYGQIPGENNYQTIFYYIEAKTIDGKIITKPFVAPRATYKINIKEGSNGIYHRRNKSFGEINIYPNPVVNFLNIDYEESNSSTNFIIQIFNIWGQKLHGQIISGFPFRIYLPPSRFKSGEYFIIVHNDEGGFASQKFIVK